MTTYELCKMMIDMKKTNGLAEKMDVFVLNNRLTNEQYTELVAMLPAVIEQV